MKITKKEDHYLFESDLGSYHLSISDYENLGKEKAIEFVKSELKKKQGSFTSKTINFSQARDLGFCEYGIKDFCNALDLDINKEYKLNFIKESLTVNMILKYQDEIIKLFGKSCLDKFGGAYQFLDQNKSDYALHLVLRDEFIKKDDLHILACDFAESVLPIFEKEYPEDDRPRNAIEIKRLWVKGKATKDALDAAYNAVDDAVKGTHSAIRSDLINAAFNVAREAAHNVAWSARSAVRTDNNVVAGFAARGCACAARSAVRSAVRSDARNSVTWDAWSVREAAFAASSGDRSAWASELEKQIEMTLKVLEVQE